MMLTLALSNIAFMYCQELKVGIEGSWLKGREQEFLREWRTEADGGKKEKLQEKQKHVELRQLYIVKSSFAPAGKYMIAIVMMYLFI